MPIIDIVMSVYNGERYLQEMLDSIGRQTHSDWHLVVRNNGSTDGTLQIINVFAGCHPGKVTVVDSPVCEKSIPASFNDALRYAKHDYIMYADGDDVWLDNKVEISFAALQSIEQKCGANVPVMVHTDLVLVDSRLQVISPSMWQSQKLNPARKALNEVIMHSNACGNTFIFNRALFKLIHPIPAGCIMHDYWTTCVAAGFGKIGAVPVSTILYRQHSANACGGASLGIGKIVQYMKTADAIKSRLVDKYRFSGIYLQRFRTRLPPRQVEMLEALAGMEQKSWIGRRIALLRYSLFQNSIIRTVGLLVYC